MKNVFSEITDFWNFLVFCIYKISTYNNKLKNIANIVTLHCKFFQYKVYQWKYCGGENNEWYAINLFIPVRIFSGFGGGLYLFLYKLHMLLYIQAEEIKNWFL